MIKSKSFILSILLAIGFLLLQATPLGNNEALKPLYEPIQKTTEELAKKPVVELKSSIETRKYHIVREFFSDEPVFEKFANKFNMLTSGRGVIHAGCFRNNFITHEVISAYPLSSDVFPIFEVHTKFELVNSPQIYMLANFKTGYDVMAGQYFINDVDFIGEITGIECAIPIPIPIPIAIPSIDTIPTIFESHCAQDEASDFSFIKLRTRDSSSAAINPSSNLGDSPNAQEVIVPNKFNNSILFRQLIFPDFEYTATVSTDQLTNMTIPNPFYLLCRLFFSHNWCTNVLGFPETITIPQLISVSATSKRTYSPGYILSIQDLSNNDVKDINGNPIQLYKDIYDAYGVLELPTVNGVIENFPTGACLDRIWKRVVLTTAEDNKINVIGGFSDPVAVTILGSYLYVLDQGTRQINIYKLFINATNKLEYTFIANSNFGLDLTGCLDLTGFTEGNSNILYIANGTDGAIHRVIIDPTTGTLKAGAGSPYSMTQYLDANTISHDLDGIIRIESSKRFGGRNLILAITRRDNRVLSFTTEGFDQVPWLKLIVSTKFPVTSKLANIGYNLGNNSFYVTDKNASKIHVFTNEGYYLGSGGEFGASETNNELYFPNAISSNHFVNNANEMLVINRWGNNTGFKRIKPVADISNIEVIEKAPIRIDVITDNSLDFRFSLTDGDGVDNIKLELNGQTIKVLNKFNTSFSPNTYSNNFLVYNTGSNGLAGKIKNGWNTYKVILNGSITDPNGGSFTYERIKKTEFYYIPSSIDKNFVISNSASADLFHNRTDDPFVIYKNVFVSGLNPSAKFSFSIYSGKTVFEEGCVMTIFGPVTFYTNNEYYEFVCGSNLKLIMQKGVEKNLWKSTFDGTFRNDNMISCWGEFTGSGAPFGAQSSYLKFIACRFHNYLGRAIDVEDGRAAIFACNFVSTINMGNIIDPNLTATGVFAAPATRIDVIGSNFNQNDIGIDAILSTVFVGSYTANFRGVTVPRTSSFNQNKIGVHLFGSTSKIFSCTFTNNDAGVMDLKGDLDIANLGENLFENNIQGIIFSKNLLAENGKNKFIDNRTDITYILSQPSQQSVIFNVECNYWQHGTVTDAPVFDVAIDPVYEHTFDFTPYLQKQNNVYVCTGSVGRYSQAANDSVSSSQIHIDLNQLTTNILGNDFKSGDNIIADLILQEKPKLLLSEYPSKHDTVHSYHEALLKNTLYAYLSKAYSRLSDTSVNIDFNKFLEYSDLLVQNDLRNAYPEKDFYTWLVQDRLEFLEFFLKKGSSITGYNQETDAVSAHTELTFFIYPNPVKSHANLTFNVIEQGLYTIEIYDIYGKPILKLLDNQKLVASHLYEINFNVKDWGIGIYYVLLKNNNTGTVNTKKLVLIK